MAYTKQNYQPGDVLTAEQMNKIQDAVIVNEGNIEGHIENKNNPHGVTREQINAAPDGFGLGGEARQLTSADNLDDIWQNGNYWWTWSVPKNAYVFDYDTQGAYSYMRVDGENSGVFTQTLRSHHAPNIGITMVRHRNGDTITPWVRCDEGAFAPSGYGLGTTSNSGKWNGDANTLTKQGWYRLESGTANGVGESASVRVEGYAETDLTQTAYTRSGLIKQRTCKSGTWSGWVQCDPSAFAPSGYGLGEADSKFVDNPGKAILPGFYHVANDAYNGGVDWRLGWCSLLVERQGTKILQTARYNDMAWFRYSNDGGATWQPWEWVNPPMELGKVYRTTKRHNGFPVYTVLVYHGKGTTSGTFHIYLDDITGTNVVYTNVVCKAEAKNGWGLFLDQPVITHAENGSGVARIVVTNGGDLSNHDIYVTVEFCKVGV